MATRLFFGISAGIVLLAMLLHRMLLTGIGGFLVVDEAPLRSDAIVGLNTGMEYYPRLLEAAALYKRGYAQKIVINGNRKTDSLRALEAKGFRPC